MHLSTQNFVSSKCYWQYKSSQFTKHITPLFFILHCSTNFGWLNVMVKWIYYLYVFWAAEYGNNSKIVWLALVFEIIALS